MDEEKLKTSRAALSRAALTVKQGIGLGHWLKFVAVVIALYYGGIFVRVGIETLADFGNSSLRSFTIWLVDIQLARADIKMTGDTIKGLDRATSADLTQLLYKVKAESVSCADSLNTIRSTLNMEVLAAEMEERDRKFVGTGKANVTIK